MYPGVELRLYRYVSVLAEVLNFTRAAARLHVAQPALSRQVRELEEYLGTQLFEPTKREVRLTAAGEAFVAEARLTLFHADRAVQGARAAKGQHRGPWSLGYSPLIDLRILSKVRGHLSSAHPAADVRLISAHTSEQADALVRGTLHAGLVIVPIREQAVTCEGLYRETLVESAWYPYGRSQSQRTDETVVKSSLVVLRTQLSSNGGYTAVQNCDHSCHHH